MKISHFDHIVLTVKDIDKTIEFYTKVLGFQPYTYGKEEDERKALLFDGGKINLHELDKLTEKRPQPRAMAPTPGSGDICFITEIPIKDIMAELKEKEIEIIHGPIRRFGAQNLLLSIYIRDPDGNLVEIANNVT